MAKLRMAVIGAGVWGETHAYLYDEHPDVELVGICDLNKARAEALAARFGVDHTYTDHKAMLRDIPFDAAAVVTPDFAHAELAIDLAKAGRHILLEKPLATTRDDVLRIIEAVESHDVRMMVDLHNRWSPPFATAKEALERGDFGEPYSAYFRLNDIKWVATDMLPWAASSSILWFLGSHSTDTLRWFFDDEVERVYSVSRRGILSNEGVDTEDIFQTILEFQGGGIATMENGWITPNSHPCVNDIKFNLLGTKGMVNLDLSNNQMIESFTENRSERPDVLVRHFVHGKPKGFAYESIGHFVDQLLNDKPFLVSVEDAAHTSLTILAIMESAQTKQPIVVRY